MNSYVVLGCADAFLQYKAQKMFPSVVDYKVCRKECGTYMLQ